MVEMENTIDRLLQLMKAETDDERKDKAVAEFLKDPMFLRYQSFSNQAVRILENDHFNYLYISDSITDLTGYTPEEWRQSGLVFAYKHCHPLDLLMLPWLTYQTHRALSKMTYEDKMRCLLSYDIRFRVKSGQYVRVLQHVHILELSPKGKPSILMFISSDITPYKTSMLMNYSLTVNREGSSEVIFKGARHPEPSVFSTRELEVLKLTSEGLTERDIAERLFISPETVKVHRRNMLNKTNMKNSVELVRYAYANSWLD